MCGGADEPCLFLYFQVDVRKALIQNSASKMNIEQLDIWITDLKKKRKKT